MVARDEISTKIAKQVLEIHIDTGRAPDEIVEAEGMKQVTDTGEIEAAVDRRSSPTTPPRWTRRSRTPSWPAGSWAR